MNKNIPTINLNVNIFYNALKNDVPKILNDLKIKKQNKFKSFIKLILNSPF